MQRTIHLPNLRFTHTNEDLQGIVSGLDISPADSVLAIGGSGDQAFAILEFAGRVAAVDKTIDQVEFIRQRANFLREGDYDDFFDFGVSGLDDGFFNGKTSPGFAEYNIEKRRRYFLADPKRLEKIRRNLGNLYVKEGDIFEIAQVECGFSKVYLSNAAGFYGPPTIVKKVLSRIANNLPIGGLIYVAYHDRMIQRADMDGLVDKNRKSLDAIPRLTIFNEGLDLRVSGFLPPELVVDVELSMRARRYEVGVWWPAVYRKVESAGR